MRQRNALRGSLHVNIGESSGIDVILNYQKDTPPGTAFRSQVNPDKLVRATRRWAAGEHGDPVLKVF